MTRFSLCGLKALFGSIIGGLASYPVQPSGACLVGVLEKLCFVPEQLP
jgi:branched-subunit amino acid ABC-type transport system permease component